MTSWRQRQQEEVPSARDIRDSAALGLHYQSAYIPSRRGIWLPDPPPEDQWASDEYRTRAQGSFRAQRHITGPVLAIALVQEEPLEGRGQAGSGR